MQTRCESIGIDPVCGNIIDTQYHRYLSITSCVLFSHRHSIALPEQKKVKREMAILNYICVTCAATPISQESSNSPSLPDPRQTKVVLPKKKPEKWSTGVAPGEYGGPPTTTKLRKYWGGDKDPLASDDFMWNKDFMGRFKRLIEEPQPTLQSPPAKVSTFIHFVPTLTRSPSGVSFFFIIIIFYTSAVEMVSVFVGIMD